MTEHVTIDIQDHIADVRLNRPDKMNALNWDMFDAIAAACRQLAEDRSIRVVVLSGEGRGFCAGLDLANFSDPSLTENPFGPGRGGFWPNYYQAPCYLWKSVPVPVICALHGVAYGGGFQIAMGADIRIAHPASKLSVMEIKWGIIPDMSASQTLRDLVRLDVAKELTFTGRIVEGEEARELGLVTYLNEHPLEQAMAMARDIAGRNPDAVSSAKYLLENSAHGDAVEGLRMEEKLQAKLLGTSNQMEAIMAGMEGRPAEFAQRAISTFEELDNL